MYTMNISKHTCTYIFIRYYTPLREVLYLLLEPEGECGKYNTSQARCVVSHFLPMDASITMLRESESEPIHKLCKNKVLQNFRTVQYTVDNVISHLNDIIFY